MLPHKTGWETSAAFVCYKRADIAEKVLQHITFLPGLRDPVVIQHATRETANNDDGNDSAAWWIAAVHCQPHVTPPHTICVLNLPKHASVLDLYKIFSSFGAINTKGVKITKAANGGLYGGSGIIEFVDRSAAEQAIAKLDGMRLPGGQRLKIAKKAELCGTSEVRIIANDIVRFNKADKNVRQT